VSVEFGRFVDDDGRLEFDLVPFTDSDLFVALSRAIAANTSITDLHFSQTSIRSGADAAALIDALTTSGNTTLRSLGFESLPSFTVDDVRHVAAALQRNDTLHSFHFAFMQCDGSTFGDAGAAAFATALEHNTTLRRVWLQNNEIGSAGVRALADAIAKNRSVCALILSGNPGALLDVQSVAAITAVCEVRFLGSFFLIWCVV
jgi:hypothetical protein